MTKAEDKRFDIVHNTQEIYRLLLDCMARPGKINCIANRLIGISEIPGISKPLLGLANTLIDREVSFHVLSDESKAVERHISRKTYSLPTNQHDAQYLFIEKSLSDDEIKTVMGQAQIGTLEDPHLSTTILMTVDSLSSDLENGEKLVLKGPGIQKEKSIYISGLSQQWLIERKKVNREFPLGIDMILVSHDGSVAAFPRTTIIESECV